MSQYEVLYLKREVNVGNVLGRVFLTIVISDQMAELRGMTGSAILVGECRRK